MAATSSQQEAILRAIYISSSGQWGTTGLLITTTERQQAFQVLQDFSHNFDGRIPLCLDWLQTPTLLLPTPTVGPVDVTVAAKLYACEIVAESLKKSQYTKWREEDRLRLRQSVLVAAQYQARLPVADASATTTTTSNNTLTTASLPLANKLASLLAELMVRDFPQRWTTCVSDLFSQLWTNHEGGVQIGNRMCLLILQLVAEDCTDSDFNSKVCFIFSLSLLLLGSPCILKKNCVNHTLNLSNPFFCSSLPPLYYYHYLCRFRPNDGMTFC
jgi:Exportin 1-like protein